MSRRGAPTREQREVSAMEKQEAFYAGYRDNSAGIEKEKCPNDWPAQLRRCWREGWDKSEKGMQINLPPLR